MTRLIDADAFAKKAYDVAYPVVHGRNDHERGLTLFGIAELLDEMPTVDAVPVIRCRDCKNFHDEWGNKWCYITQGRTNEDRFCSSAERKEE